jgi:hypothetical protein
VGQGVTQRDLGGRLAAVHLALREILGDQVEGDDVAEAAALADRAARAASIEGRPRCVGHAALPWPDQPHLVLWHAITLLREYRGDGHIAALVTAGLDPCEALVTHGAVHENGVGSSVLRSSRSWPDDEWEAAAERLRGRGLFQGDALSADGVALRDRIEAMTDEAAAPAWAAISGGEAERLRAIVRPGPARSPRAASSVCARRSAA